MTPKHNFRSIKDRTFGAIIPPNAAPERVGMTAAGNPDVLREAHGLEPYARKHKCGARVKRLDVISGAHARHRLDRRSRRKFAFGGDADDADREQPTQTTAPAAAPSLLPPRFQAIGQGADVINRGPEAVGRGSCGRADGHRQS
jgi:hypothetical protein